MNDGIDYEGLVERINNLANPVIDGPALLEDPEVLDLLMALPAARVDAIARLLRGIGIKRASLDEAIGRARLVDPVSEEAPVDAWVIAAAESLLRDPALPDRFQESVAAGGHVGEERTALALLLAMVTRKTPTPIHAVVKGASASGKNHTVRAVTDHLPPADVKEITDMSPKALQYGADFAGKVIVLVEQDAGDRAEYPLRIAMSEGQITVMVAEKNPDTGRMETREHTVKCGCIISTTTRAALNDENETRVLELTLDESPGQTKRITAAIADRAASPPTPEDLQARERSLTVWRYALGTLAPLEVVVPQARKLAEDFPTGRIRSRRDFPRLVAVAKASALLHQRQRERDHHERLVATDADIETAKKVCAELIKGVSPRLQQLHDRLAERFKDEVFTPLQAAAELGQDPNPTRKNLRAMEDAGLAEVAEEGKGRIPSKWRLMGLSDLTVKSETNVKIAGAVGESRCRSDDPQGERHTTRQRAIWETP
jgi:hypothetical protein